MTAVATKEAGVPALAHRPNVTADLTSEDVALPRLYIGQYMSDAVKADLVKAGSLFTATGSDDPEPNVLAASEKGAGVSAENAVTFHVLALRKGKSLSEEGGALQMWDYDDPSAPEEAWVTYSYTIAIPDVDPDMPFKWLLTRTGRPAAKQINTVLVKNANTPAYEMAFKVSTQKKGNAKGEYFVAKVSPAAASKEHIKIAEAMSYMIQGNAGATASTTNEEPAI